MFLEAFLDRGMQEFVSLSGHVCSSYLKVLIESSDLSRRWNHMASWGIWFYKSSRGKWLLTKFCWMNSNKFTFLLLTLSLKKLIDWKFYKLSPRWSKEMCQKKNAVLKKSLIINLMMSIFLWCRLMQPPPTVLCVLTVFIVHALTAEVWLQCSLAKYVKAQINFMMSAFVWNRNINVCVTFLLCFRTHVLNFSFYFERINHILFLLMLSDFMLALVGRN